MTNEIKNFNSPNSGVKYVSPDAELGKDLLEWFSSLENGRKDWERTFQEVRELIAPNMEDFLRRTPRALNRKERIFDDFPTYALGNLAAGLHSRLTNTATRWFSLSTSHIELDTDEVIARYLEGASNEIFDELANPATAFNLATHEFFMGCGAFGTAIINFIGDDQQIRLTTIPLSECYIAENVMGIVDVVFRKFELTVRQAKQKFPMAMKEGDAMGLTPRDIENRKDEEKLKFIHAVYPNTQSPNKPFKSVYLLEHNGKVIDQGFFRQFPYCVVRWTKMSGEVYGRSPGMDCLQTVRVLNEVVRLGLQSSQIQAAPPVVFENDGVLSKIVLAPWAQMMIAPGSQMPKILEVGGKLNVTEKDVERLHQAISLNFFNDLFDSKDYGNRERVTTVEVNTNNAERMERLSPILGRFETELLNTLIMRVFDNLVERGRIKPLPHQLANRKLKIIYLSPAAQALRAQKAKNTMSFIQGILPLSQIKPEILDPIDFDVVLKDLAFAYDVSRMAIRDVKAVMAIRNQRAQAQAQQAQTEQATNASQAVLNLAKAHQSAPGISDLLGGG